MKTRYTFLKGLTLTGMAALLISLTSTATHAAAIVITTDTATELSGVYGAASFFGSTDHTSVSTSNFSLLPNGINTLFVMRSGSTSEFGTSSKGSPDDPFYSLSNFWNPLLGSISGTYTNSGGPAVDFTIMYADTGSYFGTGGLLGTFSFTAQGVPDGGTTALLLGLGLLGFFLTHRLTRLAPQT